MSQFHSILSGRSEKEIALATSTLRQKRTNAGREYFASAKSLAEFLESPEAAEPLLLQRRKDLAERNLMNKREGHGAKHCQEPGSGDGNPPLQVEDAAASRLAKRPLPNENLPDL